MTNYQPMEINHLSRIVNKGTTEKLTNLEKIVLSREILRTNVKSKITFSKPILTIDDKPLFYPRTINVIQGKSGTHKSRLAEHICSVLLKKPEHNLDLIGLKASESNHSICYVDTERNLSEQYPYCLQQILSNAGYNISDEIPVNFDFITLIDIDRTKRLQSLVEYLDSIRKKHDGHVFIVLDVLTDAVENFNDPKPSLQLIDLLNSTINTFDVTFLCIIHENPFQEKARGHLGTELINKSSTALSINYEKDNKGNDQDIIKIQFLKCRSSKRIEPIYIKFSQDRNTLVYADADEIEKAIYSKDKKANVYDISRFIVDKLKGKIAKKELTTTLRQEFRCTTRTIEDRLRDILAGAGIGSIGHELVKTKSGKQVYFEVKKIVKLQQENIF
jgi:hypothetical protein